MEFRNGSKANNGSTGPRSSKNRGKGIKVAWTEIIAACIVIFCLGFILGRISVNEPTYEGLGASEELDPNQYDLSAYYYTDDGRLHYDDGASQYGQERRHTRRDPRQAV